MSSMLRAFIYITCIKTQKAAFNFSYTLRPKQVDENITLHQWDKMLFVGCWHTLYLQLTLKEYIKHKCTEVFPCVFLSCKENARVKPTTMWHGPHSSNFVLFHMLLVLCRSVYCLCVNVCCTVLYCTVQHSTVQYSTVLYCTVMYCTVLYCTVLYCTVLYCTVLLPPGG